MIDYGRLMSLMLHAPDIAAGPHDLWIKSVSAVPYMIQYLDSDNIVSVQVIRIDPFHVDIPMI